jgi:steroid delta-isomerase-like uncharacterized protein
MPTNSELADQIFAAINAHDTDALRVLWTDDVEERFPDKTCRGKDELAAYFKDLFAAMSDVRMEKVASVEQGETVFARWTLTGTHDGVFSGIDATGRSIALDGFDQITFRDGKMASNFVVFDQMDVGRQLGLLPPDGSPPDRALKAAFNAKTKVAELIREVRRPGSSSA